MKRTGYRLCYIEPRVRISALCTVFDAMRDADYSFDGESHDFWESVFVIDGEAGITAGETVYTLSAGQMIFHPPGEFHRLWNNKNDSLHIAIITFVADKFPINKHTICKSPEKEKILSVISALRSSFETYKICIAERKDCEMSPSEQKAINALEELFLDLTQDFSREKKENLKKDRQSELYSKAISTMKENLGVRLSATEIADACNVSLSALQKMFYRYTGMGVMKYYESVRMERAKALLSDGYLVKETAEALGYPDQNYFSSAYKRYFGTSPSKRN